MVLELAVIDVRAGSEDDFESAYNTARDIVLTSPGAHGVRLVRGIESPSRFVLLVEWDDVSAHEAFRNSDAFPVVAGGRWAIRFGPAFGQTLSRRLQ